MEIAKCMICRSDVPVINCHYRCDHCGFTANWDEGSNPGLEKKDERKVFGKTINKLSDVRKAQ